MAEVSVNRCIQRRSIVFVTAALTMTESETSTLGSIRETWGAVRNATQRGNEW